jgi:hypothetical protein
MLLGSARRAIATTALATAVGACGAADDGISSRPRDLVQQFATVSGSVALDVSISQNDTSLVTRYVLRNTGSASATVVTSCWLGVLLYDGLGRNIYPRNPAICRAIAPLPVRIAAGDSLVLERTDPLAMVRWVTDLRSLVGLEAEVVVQLDAAPVRRERSTLR